MGYFINTLPSACHPKVGAGFGNNGMQQQRARAHL
jgi:hypothetical protein